MKELYENKNQCCGCSACKNICPKNAIAMQTDDEGFEYPKIDESRCIDCGLCKKVCAFQNGSDINGKLDEAIVYAAKNKQDDIRLKSSSGGMFTAISDHVLKNGGIVYGAAFDEDFRVQHIRAEDQEQRDRCIGSKYSQSVLNDIFKSVKADLENDKSVLFTGTPCQVAGLNNYLENTDTDKLILVDFVCHGTPSPKLFKEYLGYIEVKRKNRIKEYYHRSKDFGWAHNEKIVFENNKIENTSNLSQAWKQIFYSSNPLRPSCYSCRYTTTKRLSDITIADFWGLEKFAPEFADKKGVSLVIVNTAKGLDVFENIKETTVYTERSIDEAKVKNPHLSKPCRNPDTRDQFWKEYKDNGIGFILKKYGRCNTKSIIKNYIKRIVKAAR